MFIVDFLMLILFRSIFMKEKLQHALPSLQQLVEGLELFGLLSKIRSNHNLFHCVFCPNEDLQWTFEKLEDIFQPKYHIDGSSLRAREIDTFKALSDALEAIYHGGGNVIILFISTHLKMLVLKCSFYVWVGIGTSSRFIIQMYVAGFFQK